MYIYLHARERPQQRKLLPGPSEGGGAGRYCPPRRKGRRVNPPVKRKPGLTQGQGGARYVALRTYSGFRLTLTLTLHVEYAERGHERVCYSYFACFVNTSTLNMCVSM